jgi:hypothetical protein
MRSPEAGTEAESGAEGDHSPHNGKGVGRRGGGFQVLPVRMECEVVLRLDEAWRRLGLRNRMDLFRRSLGAYLVNAGEHDVAVLVDPGERHLATSATR